VRRIAAHEPFRHVADPTGKLQVGLLDATPPQEAAAEALALGGNTDLLALDERELYWLPSGSTSESPLDLGALARVLGEMTLRTKGTIEEMAARHFAIGDGG